MITLSKEHIISLHKKLLDTTGGLEGIRDETMLDSALIAPFQTFENIELFPTNLAKIARMTYGLVCNHPFIDGNKRIGTYAMLILLDLNHIEINFSDDDIVHIGLSLAKGEMTDKQLLDFILEHLR